MLCLHQVGRTRQPLKCGSWCPFHQKVVYGFDIDDILYKKLIIPVKNIMEVHSQIRRDFRYIGYYQITCTDWNLLVDEEKRYVVMNNLIDMVDASEAVGRYIVPDDED